MWTVIYIAPTKNIAEKYQQALAEEGILVQLRPVGSQQSTSVSIEILVPESEAEEAHELLTSIMC
ncbi:MAG: glutamate decarboxylase [Gracilibacter sp. BRH_c7a]|nr:MAG: glutamate decarboxylase [Gracilibacter sp. BRH_c7a]